MPNRSHSPGPDRAGIHFAKVIEQLGVANEVRAKATIGSGGLIGEIVLRGEVELGFQQVSEILAVKGVDLIGVLPDKLQLNSLFAAGIGAATRHLGAARALIAQLNTEHARRIMRDNGLTPVAR
jgi:molybdate transport system substrate-binding protein